MRPELERAERELLGRPEILCRVSRYCGGHFGRVGREQLLGMPLDYQLLVSGHAEGPYKKRTKVRFEVDSHDLAQVFCADILQRRS